MTLDYTGNIESGWLIILLRLPKEKSGYESVVDIKFSAC